MIKGFSTRKITSQKTLSETLKSARLKKEISLSEAESGSKVRSRYLEAIEEGKWQDLPSIVYVRGFVLAYSKYLGIKKEDVLPLFDVEASLIKKHEKNELSYQNRQKDVKFLVTPRLLGYVFLGMFVVTMFGYIIYQIASFAGSPNLRVASPGNNTVFENDAIDVAGITDNDSRLTINDQSVPITNEGHFATNLKLHRGINVIKVKVANKAKKETTEVLTVEYKPKTAQVTDPLLNQQ